jgi:acyl carrier protein
MPKGVMVRHRSLVRFLDWFRNDVELDSSSVLAFTSPPFFDQTFRLFAMFLVGGHVRVYPEEAGRLGVFSCLMDDRCTYLICTPSIAAAMLQLPDLRRPTRLRTFGLGGEGFSTQLYVRLRAFLGPDVRIVNNYGPTETTVAVSSQHLPADHSERLLSKPYMLPVGKAMPASYFLIMGPEMRLLPPGFVGEVCIGGQQLAEGYFERPPETQKAFVQSPMNSDLRLYRTGDVGRLAPDGTLVIFGRADSQLKFNGIRIEPFQVELALMKHPDIVDAAVALRGEPANLCAWYVSDRDVPVAELRQVALKSIQPGMFPTKLMRVTHITRTPSGKRDYASLPDHDVPQPVTETPSTPRVADFREDDVIAQSVAAIWRDVLQRTAAWDPDLGFDDLGGDSLATMRMIFQVEHLFGIELDQISFTEINSVRLLSDKIRSIKSDATRRARRAPHAKQASEADATIQSFLPEIRRILDLWPGEPVGDSGMIRVLNRTGGKAPLVWCFNDSSEPEALAAALGSDQPLYILRSAHGLIDQEIKEMYETQIAEIYAREVFRSVAKGRVAVGGNCQGSRIALMLANTLLHLKIDVATVLLVEPAFPIPYPRRVMLMLGSNYSRINPVFAYGNPHLGWNRYFRDYRAAVIRGGHGEYFRPGNVSSLADVVEGEMDAAFQAPSLRAADTEKAVQLAVSAAPQHWKAGNPDVVEIRLSIKDGYTLVMNEESGITVTFRWDCALPLVELPRPASGFPSRHVLRGGQSALERFSVQPPRAKGRYTLVVQLCEEGVRYLGEPVQMAVDLF